MDANLETGFYLEDKNDGRLLYAIEVSKHKILCESVLNFRL